MVNECELVKLQAKNVEVGTSSDRTPENTKSPWGGLTVLHADLLTTKAKVLLGFMIMHRNEPTKNYA